MNWIRRRGVTRGSNRIDLYNNRYILESTKVEEENKFNSMVSFHNRPFQSLATDPLPFLNRLS